MILEGKINDYIFNKKLRISWVNTLNTEYWQAKYLRKKEGYAKKRYKLVTVGCQGVFFPLILLLFPLRYRIYTVS